MSGWSWSTSVRREPRAAAPSRRWTVQHPVTSLGVVGVAVSLLPVLLFSAARLSNTDTWFHLTLGRHFLDDWSLSHPGGLTPFCTSPWVPSQWLPEVLAAGVEGRAGLPGVAWLFGALYLAVILTVWYVAWCRGTPAVASFGTLVFVFAAAPVLSARPQILSVGLVVVVLDLWLGAADDGRPRWSLIAVHWAWCMLHGLWSLGLLLGLVVVAGSLIDRRWRRRQAWQQVAVLAGCALVSMATPRAAAGDLTARRVGTHGTHSRVGADVVPRPVAPARGGHGRSPGGWRARRSVPTDWTRILLLGLAVGSSVWVVRLVPLAAAVVVVLFAEAVQRSRFAGAGAGTGVGTRIGRAERVLVGTLALCYLVGLAVLVPHTATEPEDVPSGLGPRLDGLADGSVVMVEDLTGSWLEWRSPGLDPVIDGMLDAYPVDRIQAFVDSTEVTARLAAVRRRSGARVAVSSTAPR